MPGDFADSSLGPAAFWILVRWPPLTLLNNSSSIQSFFFLRTVKEHRAFLSRGHTGAIAREFGEKRKLGPRQESEVMEKILNSICLVKRIQVFWQRIGNFTPWCHKELCFLTSETWGSLSMSASAMFRKGFSRRSYPGSSQNPWLLTSWRCSSRSLYFRICFRGIKRSIGYLWPATFFQY